MMVRHRLIGHDGHARAGPKRVDPLTKRSNEPTPDDDVVSARAERHRHQYRLSLSQGCSHDGFSLPRPRLRPRQFGSLAMISSIIVS